MSRTYALTVVCTLGLGIGATTAVFSVVDGVLLRPTPFADVDRLVMVWGTDRASGTVREPVSVPDYLDFQSAAAGISQLAAFRGFDVNATPPGHEPVRLAAVAATRDFLPLVGVLPILGRTFVDGEDMPGGARTVLIGETLWNRAFGRDPMVIGQTVDLNGERFTIQGVVPRGADFGVLQVLSAAAYARGFADRGSDRRRAVAAVRPGSGSHARHVHSRTTPRRRCALADLRGPGWRDPTLNREPAAAGARQGSPRLNSSVLDSDDSNRPFSAPDVPPAARLSIVSPTPNRLCVWTYRDLHVWCIQGSMCLPRTWKRQRRLLDAAASVFMRFGFRKTSMEDIARAAGVSRQGLYLHYATKEDLFRAAVQHLLDDALGDALARFAEMHQ